MPAFSGANIAGFMLAVLSIMSTTKVGTLLVVLGVPLVDSGYTLIRRIASGKSPFWGDRGHLHHKLLEAGLSKRQVASLYWLFSAILGAAALSLNTTFKFYTIIFIVFLVGGVLLLLTYRQSK
jgi:UDP-GlcNAc:undecaprenyl-phosphate GlcNAc-1-phosphate transferase